MSSERHERLTALFTNAVDLSPAERDKVVDKVRAEDSALADELAALLAADAGSKLDTAALTPSLRGPRSDGLSIPGYTVLDVIGEGGMGTVYAGEQAEPKRPVAIKVLYARSENAVARFRAEAAIMARLDHPGIARVLEAGESDGKPYLVMEHVDGETLDGFVRGKSRSEKLRLFLAVCDAVHHAHLKSVIHRDLKPANVMVRADGRPIVLDFGVARLADAGQTPGQTRAGELIGTPLYMSPEQASLRASEVDARTDVYSLGVMLYELASGELPYDIRELPLPAITTVITEDDPVPLGKRVPELAGDLEAICGKALAKDPEERYASVAALADDVRRYLEGRPVSVRSPGTLERARKFVRRRPLLAAAIAGIATLTIAVATVMTVLWLETRTARAALEVRANQLVLAAARDALARDPTDAVAWLATLTPHGTDPAAAWAVLDEAVARGVAIDVLRGHTDEVHWVEPLPHGGFVTGGYDGRAVVWDAPAFAPRVVMTATHGRVHAVRPSPDGKLLAIGCDGGEAKVVSLDGSVRATLPGHTGDVQNFAWSPDGAWLATSDDHGNTWVWPHAATPGRRVTESHSAIGAVAWSADSRTLVAGDHDGQIWLWSTDGLSHTARIDGDSLAAWTDGTHVAAADADGAVHRWHVDGDGLAEEPVIGTQHRAKRALFSADGSAVLFGGIGGEVMRVELAGSFAIETLAAPHRAQVRSLAVSDDGRWIADGGDDSVLVLHDRMTHQERVLRGHAGRIRHVAFAGDVLLSADSEGIVRRWELRAESGAHLFDAAAPADRIASDGTHLAAVDAAGDVWSWTIAGGHRTHLGHLDGGVTSLAMANGIVITGNAEGDVTFWTDPIIRRRVQGTVTAIAADPARVAVATSAGPIALFTIAGEPVGAVAGNTGGTDAIALAGDLLVSGGQDRELRLWRRTGDAFAAAGVFGDLRGDIHFIAFAGSDRVIAAGNDGAVRVWSVAGGAATGRILAQHTGAVTALAVAGDRVASAGRDDVVISSSLTGGPSSRGRGSAAVTALAIDERGEVHALTRTGSIERASGSGPVVERDHGGRAAVQIGPDRWLVALDDGAIVERSLTARALDELRSAIAAVTHHRR